MNNISIISIFIAGIISFFSPCIIPLLPVYLAHINQDNENNNKLTVIINTLAFILGILSVFFIISIGIKNLSALLVNYKSIIQVIGGLIIALMALHSLGLFKIKFMDRSHNLNILPKHKGIFKSFMLGFLFSFSWSPCVGPILASIIAYTISSSKITGFIYIIIYGIGFSLPFLIIGIGSNNIIGKIRKHQKIFNKLIKFMNIILLIVGLSMIYDVFNNQAKNYTQSKNTTNQKSIADDVIDFELKDQNNKIYKLSDYRGKHVTIIFGATWCNYCKMQNNIVKQYLKEHPEKNIILIMSNTSEKNRYAINDYAGKLGLPILNDTDGMVMKYFNIHSFPNIFFIGPDGKVIAKLPGAVPNIETLADVIKQAEELYKK